MRFTPHLRVTDGNGRRGPHDAAETHGTLLNHHHAAVLPPHTGTQGLRNGTPRGIQRGESHKKATFRNDGDSVNGRNVLMAEREGFEPSIELLNPITVQQTAAFSLSATSPAV